jgi:hypothetical protein
LYLLEEAYSRDGNRWEDLANVRPGGGLAMSFLW